MTEWLLIDGYNVINNWKEFKSTREEDLGHARDMLLAIAAEYAAFKGQRAILVFDAQEMQGLSREESHAGADIVFTAEGETADSWIEHKTYELAKEDNKVFVVTSDYAEQIVILGIGAYRISAREFREEYLAAKKQMCERTEKEIKGKARNEVGNRLNDDVLRRLELLRR